MKSSCRFLFNHPVLLCPNLYSIHLHNSLRTRSILVLVLSTAEPSWTLFCDIFISLTHGFSAMTDCKRPLLSLINLRHVPTENMSCVLYPLLCDVTAYAEVCWPSPCLETGCITPLFSWNFGTQVKSIPIPTFSHILSSWTTHRKHSLSIVAWRRPHKNKSRGSYLASPLARWLLPSNEL
jgi:hypothetical protein